ncbi:MAG: SH3 domain-containing protein [Christensenella sp.]|nr:SH3 domain-containing protein [Christensenella sp.]
MIRFFRVRRGIAAALALALLLLVAPVSSAPADSGVSFIRVLLSTQSAQSLSVPVKGTYTLAQTQRTFTGGTLTISASGSTVTVKHSSEGQLYSGSGATIERVNLSRDAGYLTVKTAAGTRNYLGNFAFSASNGTVVAVNRVPLSHYLYGVVGYEMSNTFPLEALKAQALAAKGYGLLKIRQSGTYDILDTADDQVYKGYDPSYQNVINAVDQTMGDVLYYNNVPLLCYYAASNGGWMILPSDRWTSPIYDGAYNYGADPYDLQNPSTPVEKIFVPANYSERDMGTAAFAFLDARLMAAIAERGLIPKNFYFGGIQSIDSVVSSGTAGYADDLNHTTIAITATVQANLLESLIPSPTPTFAPTPSPTPTFAPTPSPTPTFAPTPEPTEVPSDFTLTPLPEGETPTPTPEETASPSPTPTFAPTPSPTPAFDPTPSPTPAIETQRTSPVSVSFRFSDLVAAGLFPSTVLKIFYAAPANGGWYLYHARYGHGVGMSQRGAQFMANSGMNYREILSYYYPGATLGTLSYVFPETVGASQPSTAQTTTSTGKVQGGTVNVRSKASTTGSVLETLSAGTQVTLLGMTGEWYSVLTPGGNNGFIRYDYIMLTGSGLIAQGKVSASAVNYRSGPATSYSAVGQLSQDTQLGIYGMVSGWYKVKAMSTGQDGFISKDYVVITQSTAQNPGATPAPTQAGATPAPTAVPTAVDPGATPSPVPTAVNPGATPTPTAAATPTQQPTPTPAPTPTLAPNYAAGGVINADGVNIRAGVSTTTRSYGRLLKNTRLGLYEKIGSWYRVRVLSTGLEGYVYAKYVSITQTSSGSSGSSGTSSSAGYINASGVNLRTGADTRYNSIGKLARNTSVKVVGSSGSWYQIEVPSAKLKGYVFAKYVTLAETVKTSETTGVVIARLNLRAQPSTSTSSKILLTMDRGVTVTIYSTANGWCYVDYNGTKGYCYASYVKVG